MQPVQVAERRKVLEREADRVEDGHLSVVRPAGGAACQHLGELDDRKVRL
jgi:hypothetical protein